MRFRRFTAGLIDIVLLSYFPLVTMIASGLPDHLSKNSHQYILYFLLAPWIGCWLLTLYLCVRTRQTIGKWLVKIKVVRTNGLDISLIRLVVLRNLLPFSFFILIGFVDVWITFGIIIIDQLFVFGRAKKSLRDYLADTKLTVRSGVYRKKSF